jgi:hypothetical protein
VTIAMGLGGRAVLLVDQVLPDTAAFPIPDLHGLDCYLFWTIPSILVARGKRSIMENGQAEYP